ncbi:hypothetical protein D9M71_156820 [compost metagenome]
MTGGAGNTAAKLAFSRPAYLALRDAAMSSALNPLRSSKGLRRMNDSPELELVVVPLIESPA